MKRLSKVKNVLFLIPLIILAILILILICNRDNIIILYHLKGYYIIRNILLFLSVSLVVIQSIVIANRKRAEKENMQLQAKKKDHEEKSEAFLSVSGNLNSAVIQKLLVEKSHDEWSYMQSSLLNILEQLIKMDTYQVQLSRLLANNGAKALNSTQEVLDKVEQYLCRNVRKCLNYMDVADPQDPKTRLFMQEKVAVCIKDNDKKLGQIDDFLKTIVEFLNKQGDEEAETSINLLDTYKKTIMESINGEF